MSAVMLARNNSSLTNELRTVLLARLGSLLLLHLARLDLLARRLELPDLRWPRDDGRSARDELCLRYGRRAHGGCV